MSKYTWSRILGVISAVFAIGFPFLAILIKYGRLFEERQGFAFVTSGIIVAFLLGLGWIMNWLKNLADHGMPMEKTVAREIRFLIPILISLSILSVIHYDLGGIVTVLGFGLIGNAVAIPLRIISYRLGRRYEFEMASINTVNAVQALAIEADKHNAKQSKKPKAKAKGNIKP